MLINCIAYQDGRKLADIPINDIHEYINRPDCFVWVALKDASEQELETLQKEFDLHELAVEDAHQGHHRPKVEEYGESLFAVLHLLEVVDHQIHVGEIDVFVGRRYILSVRNRSKQNFIGVRDRCEREPELLKHGSGFVLYALIDAVVDRYFPIIDMLEVELEDVEGNLLAKGSARTNIEQLYDLKSKVVVMKHAVLPLMEATGKLYGGRVPAVCTHTQEYFRDVYDHLARMNTSIDTIREAVTTAIQVNLSVATIEDTDIMKRLGAWGGILGTAITLAVVWEVFHRAIPVLGGAYGYFAALAATVGACVYLHSRFKKWRWL